MLGAFLSVRAMKLLCFGAACLNPAIYMPYGADWNAARCWRLIIAARAAI